MKQVIRNLCEYLIADDYFNFDFLFQKDAKTNGYSTIDYYNFLRRNLAFINLNQARIDYQADIVNTNFLLTRIFINEILILEEFFIFDPKTKLLLGTNSATDCFGKLGIFNDKIERLLTIRPKRGVTLKKVLFFGLDLKDPLFINKGTMFDDGYYSGHFSLYEDDFLTKLVKIKIITDQGIENQKVILRGLDYPFFKLNKPIIINNQLILTENIQKIYKLSITLENGDKIDFEQTEISKFLTNTLFFKYSIKEVYQSINGCAMNYFITKS